MTTWSPIDGPAIVKHGRKMAKKRNPVYLFPVIEEATVNTNEGPLAAHVGDWVAHDPISGHVWPVTASYVAVHYEPF